MRKRYVAAVGVLIAALLLLGFAARQLLPEIIERPAEQPGDTLAVFLTGDGGWGGIERVITHELNNHGISVVGFNSLRYFWTPRTPEGTASDIERILASHLARWPVDRVVMIGYSRGADVLPFIVNRISPELRRRIALVALLGIEPTIDFNLRVMDLLRGEARSSDLPVLPEARKLDPARALCIAGTEESNSLCSELKTLGVTTVRIEGGHHFGGHYPDVAGAIIAALKAGQP